MEAKKLNEVDAGGGGVQGVKSPSLQAYLQALPGHHYRAKGMVVATDGSLRTHKHTSGEMSMGAGVASDDGTTRISVRVGGQFSSTRAELAAIAMALRSLERTPSLAILVDSAASLQRLAWCRSSEFRPSPRRLKDMDIMHDIMSLIQARQDAGFTTTCVKVGGWWEGLFKANAMNEVDGQGRRSVY